MSKHRMLHLIETNSTNSYLKELVVEESLEEGFTVYTDYQSAGRGQRGNSWESAHGLNLLFSTVLFPVCLQANSQFLISQLVSLAIKDVLDQYTADISIKWPNDIYWKDQKIAGMLIENSLMDNSIEYSIVGVGLNVNQTTFESDAPNPISLTQITGTDYNVVEILTQIVDRILYYNGSILKNPSFIKNNYKESLYRKEGIYPYTDNGVEFLAQIYDVEDSGVLVLKLQNGDVRKFAFKEVKYLL